MKTSEIQQVTPEQAAEWGAEAAGEYETGWSEDARRIQALAATVQRIANALALHTRPHFCEDEDEAQCWYDSEPGSANYCPTARALGVIA